MNLPYAKQEKIRHLANSLSPDIIGFRCVTVREPKVRTFIIPNEYTKEKQRDLLEILSSIHFPIYVFSQRGSSYINMAEYQLGLPYLINVDLKSFYPSIHYERVKKIFKEFNIPASNCVTLTHLTTYQWSLPLGFPTSTILSNMIVNKMDRNLRNYAQAQNMKYSRYVDDMTFSGNKIERNILKRVRRIVGNYGFELNDNKTSKVYCPEEDKKVLGLLLTKDKVTITPEYIAKVEEDLEGIIVGENYELDMEDEKLRVEGELNHLKQVDEEVHRFIQEKYRRVIRTLGGTRTINTNTPAKQ